MNNGVAPQVNFYGYPPNQGQQTFSKYASDAYNGVVDTVQPVYKSAVDTIAPTLNKVNEMASDGIANIQKGVSDILPKIPSLEDNSSSSSSFSLDSSGDSSSSSSSSSSSFFQLNSLVTKVAFLLFVVLVFLLFVKLTLFLMAYFYQKKNNPLLIDGSLNAKTPMTISRDPLQEKSVALPRSNNQFYGAEFTWSAWLNVQDLDGLDSIDKKYYHVFHVGNKDPGIDGLMRPHNAPGVYLTKQTSSSNPYGYDLGMRVVMDTEPFKEYTVDNLQRFFDPSSVLVKENGINTTDSTVHNKYATVSDLPFNNWFHLIVRMENSVLDVYINGTIVSRIHFDTVPKQNYYDVQVCQNGGFQGYISNLQYFAYALNVFDINSLVLRGPNVKMAAAVGGPNIAPINSYDYLSSLWYFKYD